MRQDICGAQFSEVMMLAGKLQWGFNCGMLITITLQVLQILVHLLDGRHQASNNISELPLFVEQASTGTGILDLSRIINLYQTYKLI